MFLSGLIGNMNHDVADMMELVWVFLTIGISLVVLLGFGRWWQK